MTYRIRVTLPGLKGFFRVYDVNADNSLYTFHKQLRSDLELPMDQPILFKAFSQNSAVVARWALVDLGAGTVDTVKLSDAIKKGVVSFIYFYDIASKKNLIITIEGESDSTVASPTLIERKGPVPAEFENGYVAFEDLPDDRKKPGAARPSGNDEEEDNEEEEEEDDDDDDEEEDEKEEEDIIYDENE